MPRGIKLDYNAIRAYIAKGNSRDAATRHFNCKRSSIDKAMRDTKPFWSEDDKPKKTEQWFIACDNDGGITSSCNTEEEAAQEAVGNGWESFDVYVQIATYDLPYSQGLSKYTRTPA